MDFEAIHPLRDLLGLREDEIDTLIIRELIVEQYDEAHSQSPRGHEEVWLGCYPALDALAGEYDLTIYYHRITCDHLEPSHDNRFCAPVRMANRCGFKPCPDCMALTLELWASTRNIDPVLVDDVMSKRRTTVSKWEAVALLEAIGEPVHPSLKPYRPARPAVAA